MLFRRLCEIVDIVKPAEIAYDPIYLGGVAAALAARFGDAPLVVEQRQNIISLDPSLRTAQGLIRDRRLVGRGDPVMDWMVSNARAKPRGEFLQVFKQMTTAKIDGVQAMLTAMARMAAPAEDVKPSYLESDPLMVLG
jgi:phage terminase large subunit-like protein